MTPTVFVAFNERKAGCQKSTFNHPENELRMLCGGLCAKKQTDQGD